MTVINNNEEKDKIIEDLIKTNSEFSDVFQYMQFVLGQEEPGKGMKRNFHVHNSAEALCKIVSADMGAFLVFKNASRNKNQIPKEKLQIDTRYSVFHKFNFYGKGKRETIDEKQKTLEWIDISSIICGPQAKNSGAMPEYMKSKYEEMDKFLDDFIKEFPKEKKINCYSYLWYPIICSNEIMGGIILLRTEGQEAFKLDDTQKFIILPEFLFVLTQLIYAFGLASRSIEDNLPYKRGHSQRIRELCVRIHEKLLESDKYNEGISLRDVEISSALHDIGKTCIAENSIFQKPIGAVLSKTEHEDYKNHPTFGANMVAGLGRNISEAVKYHHECWDGTGFPERLKYEHIPVIARIIDVACTFDSELMKYMYNEEKAYNKALEGIMKLSGKTLDPQIVEAMAAASEGYFVEETQKESYISFENALKSLKTKQYDQAVSHLEEAADKDSKNVMLQMAVAKKMTEIGVNDKAINHYSKALDICPTLVEAYYERGMVYEKADEFDEAGIDYGIAVTICPTYIEAHLRFGFLRSRRGKYEAAISSFDKVLALDEENIIAYFGKGECLAAHASEEGSNDYEDASSLLKKALSLFDHNMTARERAKKLYSDEDKKLREEINDCFKKIKSGIFEAKDVMGVHL